MRSPFPPITCTIAFVFVCGGACMSDDSAHTAIYLMAPYSSLPPAPAGGSIEAGTKMALDARQQEAVVAGVTKWLKDPGSAQFGPMGSARNSHGTVTVCGHVTGRNGGGAYVGMAPYIVMLMGTPASPDFVVVGIGASSRERAEVTSLCRESGVALVS